MEHLNLDKDFIPRSAMDNWNDFLNWKKPWELLLINSNKIGLYSNHHQLSEFLNSKAKLLITIIDQFSKK